MTRLVFVYNADGGLFNTVTDIAHKIFSPKTYQCQLCMLTYGTFQIREEWEAYLRDAPFETEFLHRDEFIKTYPGYPDALPAVYRHEGGRLVLHAGAEVINACDSLDALKVLLESGERDEV
ncbi:MAG: hypothetical protein ACWA5X_08780 [bacterium]